MITDAELLQLRGTSGLWHLRYYTCIFSLILKRQVTDEEALDAINRLNGPGRPGETWADVRRQT